MSSRREPKHCGGDHWCVTWGGVHNYNKDFSFYRSFIQDQKQIISSVAQPLAKWNMFMAIIASEDGLWIKLSTVEIEVTNAHAHAANIRWLKIDYARTLWQGKLVIENKTGSINNSKMNVLNKIVQRHVRPYRMSSVWRLYSWTSDVSLSLLADLSNLNAKTRRSVAQMRSLKRLL